MSRRPPRVLYASTSDLPSTAANSVAVVRMCEALVQEGCEVRLVGRRVGGPGDPRAPYGVGDDLRMVRVRAPGPPLVHRIPYLAVGVGQVAKLRPDLVYSRDPTLLLALPRLGARTVYEVHHPVSERAERAERLLFDRRPPTLVVFISRALADHYRRHRPELDADRVLVAPSGALVGPPVAAADRGAPVVGYVGHVGPGRTDLLVDLARSLPHRAFRAYGSCDEVPGDVPPNLSFEGVLPPAEVPAVLRTLDVCLALYTSATTSTGGTPTAAWMSPLKLLEYMGQGRAVVASDLPAIRELVRPGVDAELCAPDDLPAWTRTVEALCADPARRHALGAAAREKIDQTMSWRQRARRVLERLDLPPPSSGTDPSDR